MGVDEEENVGVDEEGVDEENVTVVFESPKVGRIQTWVYFLLMLAVLGGAGVQVYNYFQESKRIDRQSEVTKILNKAEIIKKLKIATTNLFFRYSEEDASDYFRTAGFFISENAVVTAKHVLLRDYPLGYVATLGEGEDGDVDKARLLWGGKDEEKPVIVKHPEFDLAVIVFPKPIIESELALPVASKLPEEGDVVLTCGHPTGHRWVIEGGTFERGDGPFDDSPMAFSLFTYPGNSGGPIVNSDGEAISLLTRGMTGHSSGAPVNEVVIKPLLEEAKRLLEERKKVAKKEGAKPKKERKRHGKKPPEMRIRDILGRSRGFDNNRIHVPSGGIGPYIGPDPKLLKKMAGEE